MTNQPTAIAKEIFRADWDQLTPIERQVIEGVLHRINIPRDPNQEFFKRLTLGERASDTIAKIGGSWTFILLFGGWLVFWVHAE